MDQQFRLTLDLSNAAFDAPANEIARILRDIADGLEIEGKDEGKAMDENGNSVGFYGICNVLPKLPPREEALRD